MDEFRILSPSQQVAKHLRNELLGRRWSDEIPGVPALASELEVDHKTVGRAMRVLEKEGLLKSQGPGRRRLITLPNDLAQTDIRIGLLDMDRYSRDRRLTQDLEQSPYTVVASSKTLVGDLKMDLRRIKREVRAIKADAWIVYAGGRPVLEWFAEQAFPTFAMFGFMSKLPIAGAGPDSAAGYEDTVRELAALGHQRIVMLSPQHTRQPHPSRALKKFLDTLEVEGIKTGAYNLPDWEPTEDGLHTMLESLFKLTPPTAIIINDKVTFSAVLQFLLKRGIRVPDDVSLICHEPINAFNWCDDPIAYIHWDWAPISRRLRSWMKNATLGKTDHRQLFVKPSFLPGRTLGPPAK